ncbi:MAG: Gfo/Idh/MocA family oxidoreductase, partial [Chloroflexota bacterium]
MTLGIGVIGVGVLGRRHAENVARLGGRGRLVAVSDVNATAAEAVGRELGCDWYTDPYQLIDRSDIQAVIIVTGSDTHAPLTIAAAGRGKDVFCEKPLAPTVEEARAAVDAVNRAGVRLQIGFMRRYDPSYREAYEAIDRGEIGRPVIFTAVSR